MVRQGLGTTGLSLYLAPPSKGLGTGPPLRTFLQTTIWRPKTTNFHGGLFPVRSPLLRESFHSTTNHHGTLSHELNFQLTMIQTLIRSQHPPNSTPNARHVLRQHCVTPRFSGLLTTSQAANRPRRRNPNISLDHLIGRSDGRYVQRAGT
ncbi:hypothetical protein RJT34_20692 [Clitoria ternatea]|uniref:Uncharacterized protein n=1 Tax=Clitoria ternatea TaxID=43366 RepID=A0AAN9ITC4_CLITE